MRAFYCFFATVWRIAFSGELAKSVIYLIIPNLSLGFAVAFQVSSNRNSDKVLIMARVTIEDCLENVENRFKLVLLASKRARQLEKGADEFVPRGKDKDTVVALREIAAGFVNEENIDRLHRSGYVSETQLEI